VGLRELFRRPSSFASPSRAPLVAAIVLGAPKLPDETTVHARLARLWPGGGTPGQCHREDAAVRIAIPGGALGYDLVSEPFDVGALRGAIDDAVTWWPDAVASFRGHQAYLRVSTSSSVLGPVQAGLVHTAGVTALLEELASRGAAVSGVVWNTERVYPADFVVQHARAASAERPPLGLWVGFHFGKPGAPAPAYTTGLPAFGLMNIEVADDGRTVEEVVSTMRAVALHLLRHGPIVQDGDTIRRTETERIRVRVLPSFCDRAETVYRIVW
jgi:hypothetical protein